MSSSLFPSLTSRPLRIIGLMTGWSMDGIDVGILETDGSYIYGCEKGLIHPYDPALKRRLRKHIGAQELLPELETEVTNYHIKAIEKFLSHSRRRIDDIDLIGMHGQTIAHDPRKKITRQLGRADMVAEKFGIPVVSNFRSKDLHEGGQGYPLSPIFIQAIARKWKKPLVYLNLGGAANVTYLDEAGNMLGFDTGPANFLVDEWVHETAQCPFDKNGALALRGKVDEDLLQKLLAHPFFKQTPPKALDRTSFDLSLLDHVNCHDGCATLTAFSAESIARAVDFMPQAPLHWYISGGGRHNKAMMKELETRLTHKLGEPPKIFMIDDFELGGDTLEAQMIGYLTARSVLGLPLTFPETTGVKHPMIGGEITAPPSGLPARIQTILRAGNSDAVAS